MDVKEHDDTTADVEDEIYNPAPAPVVVVAVLPLVNVIPSRVVVVLDPLETLVTRLAFRPSNVHVSDPAPTTHFMVSGFVMHSDDGVGLVFAKHSIPVKGMADGVNKMVLPTAALLYAISRSEVSTDVANEEAVHPNPLGE